MHEKISVNVFIFLYSFIYILLNYIHGFGSIKCGVLENISTILSTTTTLYFRMKTSIDMCLLEKRKVMRIGMQWFGFSTLVYSVCVEV